MSTKKINAGDTLTVGDLTDDHLGAVIEVGPVDGFTTSLELKLVSAHAPLRNLWSTEGGFKNFRSHDHVTVITPPPMVQPEEPTELGQCIRIEGEDWLGVVIDPDDSRPIRDTEEDWWNWEHILELAGDRRILVSDPPRWPDEDPVVPDRIEAGEWPDDDTHLREWEWVDCDGARWRWNTEKVGWVWYVESYSRPLNGPLTRGERVT